MAVALAGKIRAEKGKTGARKLRREEYLPAILYGLEDNVCLKVPSKELRKIVKNEGVNVLIDLSIEGDSKNQRQVMLKDFQTHPLKNMWLHVDFLELNMNKKIKTGVPVKLIGRSPGEKHGGLINQVAQFLDIECLPGDIPRSIDVNMEEVELGQVVHVSDLAVLEKIHILNRPEDAVVSVYLEKVQEEKPEEEEVAEEGVPTAEAAPAEEESAEKK